MISKRLATVKMEKITNPVTADVRPPKIMATGQKLAPPVPLDANISRNIIHDENKINGVINENTYPRMPFNVAKKATPMITDRTMNMVTSHP